MKEIIATAGLAILGVFLLATLVLGDTNSLKTSVEGVSGKVIGDIQTNVVGDSTN